MKKYLLPFLLLTACGGEKTPKYVPPQINIPLSVDVSAQKRFALVIGNGKYNGTTVDVLANPTNDAALVSESLKAIGFEVTTLTNLNRQDFFAAVTQFSQQLKANPKSVGLFYYGGHGMEVGETNYLLPVDLSVVATNPAELEANLQMGGYPLSTLIQLLEGAGNPLNLLYLDACRNNPFRGMGRALSGARSFSKVSAKVDIYIGFSTAPGHIAQDFVVETDKNSPFATAFAAAVQQPNQSFEDSYKTITNAVLQKTGNTQTPWSNGSVTKKFVFLPTQAKTDAPAEPAKVDNAPIVVAPTPNPAPALPAPVPVARPAQSFEPEMVFVQGGTFQMGGNDKEAESDEKPVHTVKVDNFSIGKHEVTQAQWRAVMGNSPSSFKNCDNCPVEQVSWEDIQQFLSKLNSMTGKRYRLPTEAEWEYAARGGSSSKGYKYSGSNDVNVVAWYGYENNAGKKTHPVGTRQANELGIHDMSGNVWEWCSDWYGSYSSAAVSNPTGAATGARRVLRGGSWRDVASLCRVAYRGDCPPSFRGTLYGFRVVSFP